MGLVQINAPFAPSTRSGLRAKGTSRSW